MNRQEGIYPGAGTWPWMAAPNALRDWDGQIYNCIPQATCEWTRQSGTSALHLTESERQGFEARLVFRWTRLFYLPAWPAQDDIRPGVECAQFVGIRGRGDVHLEGRHVFDRGAR